jgi:hypothetical protein
MVYFHIFFYPVDIRMVHIGKWRNFEKIGKHKFMLRIHYKGIHQKFWDKFISHLPEKAYFTDKNTKITFSAEKIQTLEEFKKSHGSVLSYHDCLSFFKQIGKQILALEIDGITIPYFTLHDFVVIDGQYFLFMNTDKLFPIDKNNKIRIDTPFDKDICPFFSPELKIIDTIPSEIYFTSSLFSLAKLTIFLLTNEFKISEEMKKKGLFWNQIDEGCVGDSDADDGVCCEILLLGSIFYTKLYWALKRCLYKNPKKRYFLII